MLFSQIIGQTALKEHLLSCVQEGRVPHALLFWGNEGTGKLPLALALAHYLHCSQHTQKDACGTCLSCKQMSKYIHPDLHFVFPIVKEKGKDTCDDYLPIWREMLLENPYFTYQQWLEKLGTTKQALIYSNESDSIIRKLSYKSYESDYKVMIIWLPEKMHEACANKLLKILEEPPTHTFFFLISEEPEQILPTILSRTQMIHVPVIDREAMSEKFGLQVARIARGNYCKAQEIVQESATTQRHFNLYRNLMQMVYKRNLVGLKAWSEEMNDFGREEVKNFLQYAQRITRESFIANLQNEELNYAVPCEQEFVTKFRYFIHTKNIEALMQIFTNAYRDIEQNGNGKIVLFDMSLQLMTKVK